MAEPEIAALQLYKPIERYHAKHIDSSVYGNMCAVCVLIAFIRLFYIIHPGGAWGRNIYWNVGCVENRFFLKFVEPFETVYSFSFFKMLIEP